jgi:hypothetical protein
MMHKKLGRQATRSEQLLLASLIPKKSSDETILIHHVTDTNYKLQLEFERRTPNSVTFERIILNSAIKTEPPKFKILQIGKTWWVRLLAKIKTL